MTNAGERIDKILKAYKEKTINYIEAKEALIPIIEYLNKRQKKRNKEKAREFTVERFIGNPEKGID